MISSGLVRQVGPYSNGGYPSTFYDSNIQSITPFMMYQDKPGILPPSGYAARSVVDRNTPFQNSYRHPKKLKQVVQRSQNAQVNLLFNGGLNVNPANIPQVGPGGSAGNNIGVNTNSPTSVSPTSTEYLTPNSASTNSTEYLTPNSTSTDSTEYLTPDSIPTDNNVEPGPRQPQGYRSRRPPNLTINTNPLPSPEEIIQLQQQRDILIERIANESISYPSPPNDSSPVRLPPPRDLLDELRKLNDLLARVNTSPLVSISSSSEYGSSSSGNSFGSSGPSRHGSDGGEYQPSSASSSSAPEYESPVTPQLPYYVIGSAGNSPIPNYSSPTLSAAQEMRDRQAAYYQNEDYAANTLHFPSSGDRIPTPHPDFAPIISPTHSEPSGRMPAMTQISPQGMSYERIIFSQLNNMNRPLSARSRDSRVNSPQSDVSMGPPSSRSDVSMGLPSPNSFGSSGPSRHGSDGGEYQPSSATTQSTTSPRNLRTRSTRNVNAPTRQHRFATEEPVPRTRPRRNTRN